MNVHERSVRAVLDVLEVDTARRWSWFGSRVDPPRPAPGADGRAHRQVEVVVLRERLYESFYVRGVPVPVDSAAPRVPGELGDFAASLRRANRGRAARQPGWRVLGDDGEGGLLLAQAGLCVRARTDEIAGATRASATTAGAEVEVLLPASLEGSQPGFVVALGERTLAHDPGGAVDRLYWNVHRRGAATLVAHLTAVLNAGGVPFRLKLLADPDAYLRCDAAVLYTPGAERRRVRRLAREVRERLGTAIGRATPALTHRLADGLALAEEPPSGESFGGHRCQLLAEALLDAGERGVTDPDGRIDAVRERLSREGIDLDRPWRARRRR